METPAQRLQKYFKELFTKFSKTPFVIPAAIALGAGVYYLVLLYLSSFCLNGLITPLFMLGILWQFGIKGIKKLLLIGLVASVVFAGVATVTLTDIYQHLDTKMAASNDTPHTLFNGTLAPTNGNSATVFKYSVNVTLPNNNTPIQEAHLFLLSIVFPSQVLTNLTMVESNRSVSPSGITNVTFTYEAALPNAINWFDFEIKINGTWFISADYVNNQPRLLIGPVFSDPLTVAGALLPIALFSSFTTSFFLLFGLLLLMIWWTRRARRMREEQVNRWEQQRADDEAKKPAAAKAKVPSMRSAMGLEKGETFVCSECGADVPADATVCPKCGEKFE